MKDIDDIMVAEGFEYYRYMDDIRIICINKFDARRAIMFLVNNLRHKHLSLNGKKTKIIEPLTQEHEDIIKPKFDLRGIDALLTTRRKANVAIGYNLLKEKCGRLIQEGAFDSREFRFCINRLSKLARCKNYTVPSGFWESLIEGVVKSIIDSPTSTDRAFEFLASISVPEIHIKTVENYLTAQHESIYEWQNYWLWKLMVIWERDSDELLRYAKYIMDDIKSEAPNISGAMLYISKFGDSQDKIRIKNLFRKDLPAFLQRHILLSIKDLDWVRDGVESIKNEMPHRLEGSYRHIKKNIREVVASPPSISISELITSIHQYD